MPFTDEGLSKILNIFSKGTVDLCSDENGTVVTEAWYNGYDKTPITFDVYNPENNILYKQWANANEVSFPFVYGRNDDDPFSTRNWCFSNSSGKKLVIGTLDTAIQGGNNTVFWLGGINDNIFGTEDYKPGVILRIYYDGNTQ